MEEKLGYQGRTLKQQERMHQTGGPIGLLCIAVTLICLAQYVLYHLF